MAKLASSKKLLLLVASSVLALGAAEIAARIRYDWDRDEALADLARMRHEVVGRWDATDVENPEVARDPERKGPPWVVSPFLGFDYDTARNQHGEDLARQAEGKADDITILLVGGSVASAFGSAGEKPLIQGLTADERFAGKTIHFLNYARPSFKQPQQLNTVAYMIAAGFRPDWVVNLDGFNEVAVASSNLGLGMHPIQPSSRLWLTLLTGANDSTSIERLARVYLERERLVSEIDAALDSPLLSSAIGGKLVMRGVKRQQRAYVSASDVVTVGAGGKEEVAPAYTGPPMGDGFKVLDACVGIWRDSSLSLNAICEAHGIRYLHLLQPALDDKGSKRLTEKEVSTSEASKTWKNAALIGYPKLRAAGEELRARGVPFYDESYAFENSDATLYFDVVHFNRGGHQIIAKALAKHMLAELE